MVIDNRFFYYDTLTAVKQKTFAGCLAITDVSSGLLHWEKLKAADGTHVDDFWGFVVEKDKIRYLYPIDSEHEDQNYWKKEFPLRVTKSRKVSYQGKGYELIMSSISINIIPKSTLTFKQLVDQLACFSHSNDDHYRLYWFIVLTGILDRANFRVSTPAGFGKNSAIHIMNSLNMSCGTIENPTFPKLKERAYRLKLLALNEIVDITKDNWRNITQFLLATGDMSPIFTNNARAHAGQDETIDISKLSIMLTYNDIDHYSDPATYFDSVAIAAVLDRFVPVRLHGRMQEDYNSIKDVDVQKLGEQFIPQYKELVSNLVYYRENMHRHAKPFNTDKLGYYSERWKLSVHRLLKVISCYCETQEEFDRWVEIINNAHQDYMLMKPYSQMMEKLKKKLTVENLNKELRNLEKLPTFVERNKYIEQLMTGNVPVKDGDWSL